MSHTPGPWTIGVNGHPFSENFGCVAIGAPSRDMAIVVFPIEDSESEANARLIAAAPDLLAALAKAQQDINWMLNNRQFLNPDCFDYIEAAIAKAEQS